MTDQEKIYIQIERLLEPARRAYLDWAIIKENNQRPPNTIHLGAEFVNDVAELIKNPGYWDGYALNEAGKTYESELRYKYGAW